MVNWWCIEGNRVRVGNAETFVWAAGADDVQIPGVSGWTLRPLTIGYEDDGSHPNIIEISRHVGQALREAHVVDAYAPHVGPASARVVHGSKLRCSTRVMGSLLFWSKTEVDGVFLEPGMAFAMCAAGCAVIIATGGGEMVVAHAGRDSLVERAAVVGAQKREHGSIVQAIVDALGKRQRNVTPDKISMHMLFAIPPFKHEFDHLDYGEYNRALAEYIAGRWPGGIIRYPGGVYVDLHGLFLSQAYEAGVRRVSITDPLAEHPRLAHTHDGKDRDRRNLILVHRLK